MLKQVKKIKNTYKKIQDATNYASSISLIVNAGHGLDYTNAKEIARISNKMN